MLIDGRSKRRALTTAMVGLISSLIGIAFMKVLEKRDPSTALHGTTWIAGALIKQGVERPYIARRKDGSWISDSDVGCLLFPFWRRRRIEFLYNPRLLEPA